MVTKEIKNYEHNLNNARTEGHPMMSTFNIGGIIK